MKPFPAENSVLVMDNCRIHHTDALTEVLNESRNHLSLFTCSIPFKLPSTDVMLLYLPPYSPDLNPIEESFSVWKAHLRREATALQAADDPIFALLESVGCITADMAANWVHHSGYIVDD